MAKLIDANMVLAKQFSTGLSDEIGNHYGNADVVFADDIENAPTVDAVEVVRCRDCKWSKRDTLLDKYWCKHFFGEMEVRENDYCSYGERKCNG